MIPTRTPESILHDNYTKVFIVKKQGKKQYEFMLTRGRHCYLRDVDADLLILYIDFDIPTSSSTAIFVLTNMKVNINNE